MRSSCSRIAGTAAAASGLSTVRRTISEPARASSLIWMAVPITSAVSVLVIDCTTTGASPPIQTLRSPCWTSTRRLARRAIGPEGIGKFEEVIALLVVRYGRRPGATSGPARQAGRICIWSLLTARLLHSNARNRLARQRRQRDGVAAQRGRHAGRIANHQGGGARNLHRLG